MDSVYSTKRRALSNRAMGTALVMAALTTRMSVSAFTAVDTVAFLPSLTPQATTMSSTKIFAKDDDSSEVEQPKFTIETITDHNRDTLLHPPSDPSRPVLVDAFAPWCGPCKLLDKVLRKAQPRYLDRVDFCRWNVNDKENTVELKQSFLDAGHTLSKLPSLIVYRDGKPVAVRPGFANEFQLDDFLEKTLPDVLERTFDENGVKLLPLPELAMAHKEAEKVMTMEEKEVAAESSKEVVTNGVNLVSAEASSMDAVKETVEKAVKKVIDDENEKRLVECTDPEECWERVEATLWQNRTVVPAMDGILLPARN